jgi:hypothetical protein
MYIDIEVRSIVNPALLIHDKRHHTRAAPLVQRAACDRLKRRDFIAHKTVSDGAEVSHPFEMTGGPAVQEAAGIKQLSGT